MSRALVTLADGDEYKNLLRIALPSFLQFSDRHGYDLFIADPPDSTRAPSWWKIPTLHDALQTYDEVLWVDADMVILDTSKDLEVPEDAWQALVRHQTGDGDVPNCGFWLVRKPMLVWLEKAWGMLHHLDSGWWEQSALMELMGFHLLPRPAFLLKETSLYEHTHWIDHGWNWHCWDTPGPEKVRVAHATMLPDRERLMAEWAEGRFPRAAPQECRHRYPMNPGCLCTPFFQDAA